MKNWTLIIIGMLCTALAPAVYAEHADARTTAANVTYADVVEVEPIIRYVRVEVPRRECWDEEVYYENRSRLSSRRYERRGSAGATIAGGLIGGVIGRQIGGGSGRDAMTVVGTLVGSALANDRFHRDRDEVYYDEPPERQVRTVERCEVRREVREEERIDGYRVTYVYDGREYSTRTEEDPGDKIKVRVSVSPLGY